MALKPGIIKEISQRNKDLAFGYLKGKEKEYKANYPQLIKYLILCFSNAKDEFDPKAVHQNLQINKQSIAVKIKKGKNKNAYLKNKLSEGIHVWTFKIQEHTSSAAIGIWKTSSGKPELNRFIDGTNIPFAPTGYFITTNGNKSDPSNWRIRCKPAYNGDCIEMKLDLNALSLTFKINNQFNTKFTDIENTTYRAVISFSGMSGRIELISYQDIYNA